MAWSGQARASQAQRKAILYLWQLIWISTRKACKMQQHVDEDKLLLAMATINQWIKAIVEQLINLFFFE